MKKQKLLVLSLLVFLLASCGSHEFDQRVVIPEANWDKENIVPFDVTVNDTASTYTFGIGLRHLENYRYSNLYVFMHITTPNGDVEHDTIPCPLATADGRWIGKSSGSMRDVHIILNPELHFTQEGTYHFEIEQAMREPVLKGISDIGLFIKKNP